MPVKRSWLVAVLVRRRPQTTCALCQTCVATVAIRSFQSVWRQVRQPVAVAHHRPALPRLAIWKSTLLNLQWLNTSQTECPVCKAGVTAKNVIPLYGRGAGNIDPRYDTNTEPVVWRASINFMFGCAFSSSKMAHCSSRLLGVFRNSASLGTCAKLCFRPSSTSTFLSLPAAISMAFLWKFSKFRYVSFLCIARSSAFSHGFSHGSDVIFIVDSSSFV